ncbi:MAG: YfhO family protein [Chloroflexi bacterium]|nr:YfhO family protein [Chloroflexota bacterium]
MRRWIDALCIAALVVLPLVFRWRVLTPNTLDRGSFPPGDFLDQFYAFARFAVDELAQRRLPLWNPYTYAGHPFLADVQSAIFYPPSLVVMGLSQFLGGFSLYALEWQAVLHFSLAGVFTFLFARHEYALVGAGLALSRREVPIPALPARPRSGSGVRREGREANDESRAAARRPKSEESPLRTGVSASLAALLTAIVFTFGGYLTAYPSLSLAILQSDVWLPLVLLGLSKARAYPQALLPRPLLLSSVCFGMALLAGHPQSAFYIFLTSAAYSIFRGRTGRKRWLDIAVVTGAALAFAAVQWLPSLEFMALSSRSNLDYADKAGGFPLQDPLQMLLPGSVSFFSPLYIGILPLALAIIALWLPHRTSPTRLRQARAGRAGGLHPDVRFWGALALLALALSFGGNLFFYPILYLFAPGFALFRQQERVAFLFSFALAMLAGFGALNLARPLPRGEARQLRGLLRLAATALGGALALFLLFYFFWMAAQFKPDSPFRDASSRAAWLLLMLTLAAGLLWLRARGSLRRRRMLLLMTVVVALDLFSVNWHTNFYPLPPEAQTRPPAWLAPVEADTSLFRTFNEYRIYGTFGDVFHLEDAWGASPLRLARYEQFAKLPMERVWALLNVKYVITWRKSLSDLGVFSEIVASEKINDQETTYVHRLQKVTPRAALVTEADVLGSDSKALEKLAAPDFDFTRSVILDSRDADASALGDLSPAQERGGSVRLVARTASSSRWEVNVPADAVFVLSENDYPGWRAFVDGRETRVMRANTIMMAVAVPAGARQVEFVFDPSSVKVGAAISFAALLGLLAAWWVVRRQ